MGLVVQKYGGTSVGSVDRVEAVADRVIQAGGRGPLVVVVSAMSGETNRLVQLAKQVVPPQTASREYDVLLASGEQVSVGLLCLAINRRVDEGQGTKRAVPLLAHQLGMITDGTYSRARIREIRTAALEETLSNDRIPVVAGFQGVSSENFITTLGRGGSDTSAVAIAAAMQADVCEIFTDVDGIFSADPRLTKRAQKIDLISYEEMMEMASLGSKVLQTRSVEIAANHQIPLHVRSSFHEKEGTHVVSQQAVDQNSKKRLEKIVVTGVAADRAQVKFSLRHLKQKVGLEAELFGILSRGGVVVDVIVQSPMLEDSLSVHFTVADPDASQVRALLDDFLKTVDSSNGTAVSLTEEKNLSKVSIIGVGMQHHPGVASKMFEVLARESIPIRLVSTSEIKVSCLIEDSQTERAVQSLHTGFDLDA